MKRTRLLVENDLETDASFIHFLQHYYHHLSSTTPDKHEARRETRGGKCENVGVYKRGEREKTRGTGQKQGNGCVATTLSLRLPNLEEHSRSLDTSLPALASSLCSHTLQSLTKTNIDRIIYPIHTIDLFISGNIDKTNVVEQKRRGTSILCGTWRRQRSFRNTNI
ncbi:hypothetical protein BLNAU_16893 [Blattamonas nauphoetae]|uniref:Uncharacterized protein n=1 Tax=Blattamonas nauphoetae TaxID=2049346 RepID=A0ABQ9X921_9EUKA|nr:hypothetical protein BLNAU_16893 [Blattamonas nauphoetae]